MTAASVWLHPGPTPAPAAAPVRVWPGHERGRHRPGDGRTPVQLLLAAHRHAPSARAGELDGGAR